MSQPLKEGRGFRDLFFSQAETAAVRFLQGEGTIDDVRRYLGLGTFGSPSRVTKLLLPHITSLEPNADTTIAVLDRAKQLVHWWASNSDNKPPQLILELARQIPHDEGYHLKTPEVLGRIFTTDEFVYALEDISG